MIRPGSSPLHNIILLGRMSLQGLYNTVRDYVLDRGFTLPPYVLPDYTGYPPITPPVADLQESYECIHKNAQVHGFYEEGTPVIPSVNHPLMTSATTPAPYVVSSSSNRSSSVEAWQAFSSRAGVPDTSTRWVPDTVEDEWIQLDLGSTHFVSSVRLSGPGNVSTYPRDFRVEYSDNGIDFTEAIRVVDWVRPGWWEFSPPIVFTRTPARYWRVFVERNYGNTSSLILAGVHFQD